MSDDKVVGGVHTLAISERPEGKSFLSYVAGAIVGRFPARPSLEAEPPRQQVRAAELAGVGRAKVEPEPPPDDPEYADDLPRYAAVRRVYRSAMHSVAFFDARGDAQLFTWTFHPRARTIGQRALLLRFAGALVLIEGDNLRQLYVDIQRRMVAEFRMHRPELWAKPDEGEPLITGVTVFEQEDGEETLTNREHRLARELAEAPHNTSAAMHG